MSAKKGFVKIKLRRWSIVGRALFHVVRKRRWVVSSIFRRETPFAQRLGLTLTLIESENVNSRRCATDRSPTSVIRLLVE